jgi:hypothetical protein
MKKCERVIQLIRHSEMLKKFYKISYEAKTEGGTMKNFSEIICTWHILFTIDNFEKRKYENFKIISVEKIEN